MTVVMVSTNFNTPYTSHVSPHLTPHTSHLTRIHEDALDATSHLTPCPQILIEFKIQTEQPEPSLYRSRIILWMSMEVNL
eukprot:SAG11_NODE_31423_length_292_cov_0.575130_1_plen_79_part_01